MTIRLFGLNICIHISIYIVIYNYILQYNHDGILLIFFPLKKVCTVKVMTDETKKILVVDKLINLLTLNAYILKEFSNAYSKHFTTKA